MNYLFKQPPQNYDYFADNSRINNSILKKMTCPSKALYYIKNPNKSVRTSAMLEGSIWHCMILEPSEFDKRYVVAPCADGRKKEYKSAKKQAEEKGLELVSLDVYENARLATRELDRQGFLEKYFLDGEAEKNIWFEMLDTQCKARIDYLKDDLLIDYKTTRDASPSGFARDVVKFGYDHQAAFYMDGYEAATGNNPKQFVFVAQEKVAPYACRDYVIRYDSLEHEVGRVKYMRNFRKYLECSFTNKWEHYLAEDNQLTLPAWAYKILDDE